MRRHDRHFGVAWISLAFALVVGGLLQSGRSQTTSPTTATTVRLIGTVTALQGSSITLTPDKGDATTLVVSSETRVLDLPPGSTDLKAAHPGSIGEVAVGDRVLITGEPGSGSGPIVARRIVMMKSAAIAQQRESIQAAWAHSRSGVVDTVDPASGAITLSSRGRTITVVTTPTTIFRRYAPDSARFEDAKRSTIADLHVRDQVRVRGESTAETVQAAEMVSGTFEQISGSVVSVDASAMTISVQDIHTKKLIVVKVTSRTELHQLSPEMAAQFAARSKMAGQGASPNASAGTAAASARPHEESDLGKAVAQLPEISVTNLEIGHSILLIASGNANALTALTILSGVEPILAATQNGGAETSLAPWSVGSGESAGSANQ